MADNLRTAGALSPMLSVTAMGNTTALHKQAFSKKPKSYTKINQTIQVLQKMLLQLLVQDSYQQRLKQGQRTVLALLFFMLFFIFLLQRTPKVFHKCSIYSVENSTANTRI